MSSALAGTASPSLARLQARRPVARCVESVGEWEGVCGMGSRAGGKNAGALPKKNAGAAGLPAALCGAGAAAARPSTPIAAAAHALDRNARSGGERSAGERL